MSTDTRVVKKITKTGTQTVLIGLAITLLAAAVVGLVNAVIDNQKNTLINQKNTEAIKNTLPLLVTSMDKNTLAVTKMREESRDSIADFAVMLYEVKERIGIDGLRLEHIKIKCYENSKEIEECKESYQ